MRIAVLEKNWWALALRGCLAVLFGLVSLARPTVRFVALEALFGAWWLLDGVLAVAAAVVGTERRARWWPLVAEGGVGIVAGATAYLVPGDVEKLHQQMQVRADLERERQSASVKEAA